MAECFWMSSPLINCRFSRVLATLLLLCATSTSLSAQVVRGRVTERGSSEPLSGVLITLESVGGEEPRAVLSDDAGNYGVRGSPGFYRLSAKRIGVQRYVSDSFRLAAGDTRQLDIVLDALIYQLPEMRIVDAGLLLSVDDAVLWHRYSTIRLQGGSDADYRRWAEPRVEALNHALRGIPEDRVRYKGKAPRKSPRKAHDDDDVPI